MGQTNGYSASVVLFRAESQKWAGQYNRGQGQRWQQRRLAVERRIRGQWKVERQNNNVVQRTSNPVSVRAGGGTMVK